MRNIQFAMDEDSYHLRFRPRAICGRRLHPNGGHRRPRPFCGVYATKYCHGNPTSQPIGRSRSFLEQESFPAPVITGNVMWDLSNLDLKDLFENVVIQRKNIHVKSSSTPKLKGNSPKVASMWKLCDETLALSREISVSLRQQGLLPYPEPLWFSSRETGMHTTHDISLWNECVQRLLAAKTNGSGPLAWKAKDGGSIFLGGKPTTEDDDVVTDRAKVSGMLAEEGCVFSRKAKGIMFPAEKGGALAENHECSKLREQEAEKTKDNKLFPAEEGAIAEYQWCRKLHEEEAEKTKENKLFPAEEGAVAENQWCSKIGEEEEAEKTKEIKLFPAEEGAVAENQWCSKLGEEEEAEKTKENKLFPAEEGAVAENQWCSKIGEEEEAEKTKEIKLFPAEEGAVAENQWCSKLGEEEEAEKTKENKLFPAEEGAVAENQWCSKLREEEERELAEKARWSNWPSSFINWNYEKNFEKEQAEAEAREQAEAEAKAEYDEWEGKAMWGLGA